MHGPTVDTPEHVHKVLLEHRSEMHTRPTGREIATVADIRTLDQVTTELHTKATTVCGHRLTGRNRIAVRCTDRRSINPGSVSLAAIGCRKTLPEIQRKIIEAGRAQATEIQRERIERRVQTFSAAISVSSLPIASRAVASSLPANRLSTNLPSANHPLSHRTPAASTYSAADTRRRPLVVARVPGTGIPAGVA